MNIRVFGSSSAGNCTFMWNDHRGVMIDCGLGFRYVSRQLHALGMTWQSVSALLITHAHSDHVKHASVRSIMSIGVPVFCPEPVAHALAQEAPLFRKALNSSALHPLTSANFRAGPFDVESFKVPHDSPGGCYGYALYERDLFGFRKVTMATDVGFPDTGLVDQFADSAALVVESNHDVMMLENSGRPLWLKRRIRDIGHLSNDQCAQFVVDIVERSAIPPGSVVLAHISQQCNTNDRAVQSTTSALSSRGFHAVRVVETFRHRPSEIVSL